MFLKMPNKECYTLKLEHRITPLQKYGTAKDIVKNQIYGV